MAILTQHPYVDEAGNVFPFLSLNIIARAEFLPKTLACPTVLNLLPYRVLADGTIVRAPDSAMRTVIIPDAYKESERDPVVGAAMQSILGGLATFIAAKGL